MWSGGLVSIVQYFRDSIHGRELKYVLNVSSNEKSPLLRRDNMCKPNEHTRITINKECFLIQLIIFIYGLNKFRSLA